jgi:RNA polymerase sigma-70 factor (ECF subfamily)
VNEEPDEVLVERYQKGDVSAFRGIYYRYRVGTFNFILSLAREKMAAEDLHQEIWTSITRAMFDWKPTGSFKSWLFQIARNRCLDHIKKTRRARIEDDGEDVIQNIPAVVPEPVDTMLRDALLSCIEQLNDSQKEVFSLRTIENMTFAEITEVMASAPGLANRRMQLAVEHVKRCLESKGIRQET